MRTRLACVFVCALLCLLGMSAAVFGQSDTAAVTGRVLDPNGAIIIEATVTAKNVDTGVATVVQTNPEGIYSFVNLSPGNYEFTVSKRGFKGILKPGVTLHLADTISMNFNMVVGELTEKITVEAGAPMINTTDASVSTVVDQAYIKNMPLNGRSFQDLILLTPGVVTQTPQGNGYNFPGASGEFSVNGQRTEENNYTVDGVSANVGMYGVGGLQSAGPSGSVAASTAIGTTQALVSVDDLQEFRVQSSTYSAEYGRNPGGQLNFETKSGTNQFHGTAYDYLRNDVFDANDWFTDYFRQVDPTLSKPATRQNDFGGTLGGALRVPGLYNGKDKTFFFASYEGLRLRQPQPAVASFVPDTTLRSSVTQNQPALAPLLNAWPVQTPNATDDTANGISQFIGSWSNPSSIDSGSIRFDQVINERLKLFFRFSDTRSNSDSRQSGNFAPSADQISSNSMRTYTAGATGLLTNRLNNSFRVNYSSNLADFNQFIDKIGGNTPVDVGQLSGAGQGASAFVLLSLGGTRLILQQIPSNTAQRQLNILDTLNLSFGRHNIKFGVDYRRLTPYGIPPSASFFYIFGDTSSVQSNNANMFATAAAPGYPLYTNFSGFVQDDWKVAPRLSLSMGLRWDVNPAPGVTQGRNAYTLQGTGPDDWSLAPLGTPLWKTAWFNFAPRLGAAYVLRDKQGWETVVRAGGGVFFDTGQQLGSLGFVLGPGFLAFGQFISGPFPGSPSLVPPSANDTTPFSYTGYGFAPHLQLPYTLQWNGSVQQSIGRSQSLSLTYVGSHASRLLQQNNYISFVNPNTSSFDFVQNGLTADYHSAQVQFQRRLSRGLTSLASYTWSHCIDYGSSNFSIGYQRGNCDFDIRHNFSSAFSYDVPNLGRGRLLGGVLHNWGIDDRFTARTAFPVTLVGSSFGFGIPFVGANGRAFDEGLDLTGQPAYVSGTQCAAVYAADFGSTLPCPGGRAINPDAFAAVPTDPNTGLPTRLGNAPRNFTRGFGAWQMDLAVRREFPMGERVKMQFRAEAFNIFNHPNFGFVDPLFGDPTFGQATNTLATSPGILSSLYQMGGPRSMQFALKLVF